MNNKFFVFVLFTFFIGVAIFMYSGHTDNPTGSADNYSHDSLLPSVYADVHGKVVEIGGNFDTKIHVHGICYVDDNTDLNSDGAGNYTLGLTVSEHQDHKWGRENFQPDVLDQNSFQEGVRAERNITFDVAGLPANHVGWTASATIELKRSVGDPFIKRDYDDKKIIDLGENPDWKDKQGDVTQTPNLGITLSNSDQTFETGDSVTLNLITAEPFYDVSWYVHTPGDTSSSGTYLQSNSGDGTSTETSLSYTFPSGAMHTGSYLFRAVIYQWSDMAWYGEETYTVSVE